MSHRIFLGLGSNLGNRENYLKKAIERIEAHQAILIKATSSMIETEPVGNISQGYYLNQVVEIQSDIEPSDLLDYCLSIEKLHGRERGEKWGPRTLDIDLLFYGNLEIKEKGLRIPHPEVHKREFMLIPLAEIAPDYIHPEFKRSIQTILREF